jgi:anti-sigma factor RsiW
MISAEEARWSRLTDYVDGELSDEERREFEAILAEDDALRHEVDDARAARLLLRGLADAEPRPVPRDFLRKVQRRARRNLRRDAFRNGNALFLGISVEIFVVIAIAAMAACWFFAERATPRAPARLQWESPVTAPAPP